MTRLPGGALLLVIGVLLLWLAITGKLDRLYSAWEYAIGSTPNTAGATASAALPSATVSPLKSLVSPAVFNSASFTNSVAT